jgi:hypothetical protein
MHVGEFPGASGRSNHNAAVHRIASGLTETAGAPLVTKSYLHGGEYSANVWRQACEKRPALKGPALCLSVRTGPVHPDRLPSP